MLKLLCPSCLKTVSVPDDAAGKDAPCPECGKPFPVPARYNPIVNPVPTLPPPPTIVPEPVPSHSLPIPLPDAHAVPPAGYTRSRGITISPGVVSWIPAVSLSLILLLTLLPWVGVYPNGHPVYTQGAWRSITGYPKRDIPLEELLIRELPAPSVYDRTSSDWFIMLPYLLALILAFAVAWAERLESAHVTTGIPKVVPPLWPYRHMVLAGFAGAALLLVLLESTRGFGLERAMEAAVSEKFEAQRKAAGTSPGEQEKVEFHQKLELAKYGLERTGWFCLVLCLHGLAVLGMLGRVALERRGNKPPPRFVIQY